VIVYPHHIRNPLPMKCNVTRQTATWLQQADLRPIIFRSYFRLQQANLVWGYSRPILFLHLVKRLC